MATTTGLVQRLTLASAGITCVWVGPNPTNTEVLLVQNDGSAAGIAYANSMIQLLSSASSNYRQVAAIHSSTGSNITSVRLDPV
jgi:hypothetical protein